MNPAAQAVELLADARRVVVFTGSGMSQESGIPTFRDAQTGLWSRFEPDQLATPQAFRRHPARVFGWYVARWRDIRAARPHAGHLALARLERAVESCTIVTQNIDRLHHRAGSHDVIELHGSIDAFRCFDRAHPFDPEGLATLANTPEGEVEPPACLECGSPVRPGVVWFGEILPAGEVARAHAAVAACDALLVVGTSGVVYPAAELPWLALENGARLI